MYVKCVASQELHDLIEQDVISMQYASAHLSQEAALHTHVVVVNY